MVSQSGAILVHFIGPCDPQTAQSFDRLRMKSKGLRMMVGGQEWNQKDAIALTDKQGVSTVEYARCAEMFGKHGPKQKTLRSLR